MINSTVSLNGESLDLDTLARIARDPGVQVTCDAEAMTRVGRCADVIGQIHSRYREAYNSGKRGPELPNVYGVTTGFGEFKTQSLNPDELVDLQANMLRSHAAGVGDTSELNEPHNYFPAEIIRAALVLRLNTFLKGHSGIRPEVVLLVRDMINAGVVPLVPTRGSVGSSGDLCPLAHLFVVLLEEEQSGRFYVVDRPADVRRNWGPLHTAGEFGEVMKRRLARHDLGTNAQTASMGRVPKPGPKEGLALTNGAAFSAAGLGLALVDAMDLAGIADVAAAMTIEALCGKTRALDPKVHGARGMRGQIESAANILAMLDGGRLADLSEDVQDAYSVRCAPQVHGASRDAISYASAVAEAEINAATDNPLFFPDESDPCDILRRTSAARDNGRRDVNAYSAGNFHGQPVGMAADVLAIALSELANISERRTQMLLDKNHNRGLPPCLARNPGTNSGLMLAQYCSAGLVSENKVLCHPACVDSIPTSANSEDHVAMASIAARKLRTVLENTRSVLAIELLTAAQAIDWRIAMHSDPQSGRPLPIERSAQHWSERVSAFTELHLSTARKYFVQELSEGVAAALRCIRRVVPAIVDDRVLAEDIRQIRLLIEGGTILQAVETQVGSLAKPRGLWTQ